MEGSAKKEALANEKLCRAENCMNGKLTSKFDARTSKVTQ